MKGKIAWFDCDGVLTDYVCTNFVEHLFNRGMFDTEHYKPLVKLKDIYDEGYISYPEAEKRVIEYFASGIKGVGKQEFESEFRKFFNKNHIKPYAYSLLDLFKDYKKIIISCEPVEILEFMKNYFEVDAVFGTILEIEDEKYTGKVRNLASDGGKKRCLLRYADGQNLTESFCFGDTENDVCCLEKVGNPVTLNPNDRLREIALERGWPILTEENNIVEEVRKLISDENAYRKSNKGNKDINRLSNKK